MREIHWPTGHEPKGTAIHEVNLGQSAAPPEVVWAWLVDPTSWSSYYSK